MQLNSVYFRGFAICAIGYGRIGGFWHLVPQFCQIRTYNKYMNLWNAAGIRALLNDYRYLSLSNPYKRTSKCLCACSILHFAAFSVARFINHLRNPSIVSCPVPVNLCVKHCSWFLWFCRILCISSEFMHCPLKIKMPVLPHFDDYYPWKDTLRLRVMKFRYHEIDISRDFSEWTRHKCPLNSLEALNL